MDCRINQLGPDRLQRSMPSRWTTATTRPLPRAREDPASFSVRLLFVGRATDPPLPSRKIKSADSNKISGAAIGSKNTAE
jgi:hypothetical protein